MEKCEKCLYYDVCDYASVMLSLRMLYLDECRHFKDKENFVEIVRCKDCECFRQYNINEERYYCCFYDEADYLSVSPDDFCSNGERKNKRKR